MQQLGSSALQRAFQVTVQYSGTRTGAVHDIILKAAATPACSAFAWTKMSIAAGSYSLRSTGGLLGETTTHDCLGAAAAITGMGPDILIAPNSFASC
jgi:hypothetical protein